MLNLTLLEREYLIELIKKDQKAEQPLSTQFYINADGLIRYIGQSHYSFIDDEAEHEETDNLCPDCNVYCTKRFIDGICE